MLFDTHTHLNANKFRRDQQEVIERARLMGVKGMAIVGFDYPTIKEAQRLGEQNDDMVSIIGWHPTDADTFDEAAETYLRHELLKPWVVGLGETGLDYYWDSSSKANQEDALRKQLAIAREYQLPVIIHNREATADCYRILKDEHVEDFGGIMHSFSEGKDWAKKFLDLGMHISFSGTVSYDKSDDIREACRFVPKDRLLIETDAPYLAPHPKRGLRNETGFVRYVAESVAKVRQVSLNQVEEQTFKNACQLFKLTATDNGFRK